MISHQIILISSLLLAVPAQGQGCSRPTGNDNTVLSNDDILKPDFPDGSKVTFVCVTGYVTAGGSKTITCTAGVWSLLMLKCDRFDCGNPGVVDNGDIVITTGTQFGDRVRIVCNSGYIIVPAGNGVMTCGAGGWLERLPYCQVIQCLPPPTVQNGIPTPVKESYSYNDIVRYTCSGQYVLNGSSSITCSESGSFQPNPPTCIDVLCIEPVIPNAKWKSGARPPYRYKNFVEYECNPGYKMEGLPSLTCDLNSKWSPAFPICKAIPTTTKATTTTTTTTTTVKPIPALPTTTKATTIATTVKAPVTDRMPNPTKPPINGDGGGGNGLAPWAIVLIIVVIIGVVAIVTFICYRKKRKGSGTGYSGNQAVKSDDQDF